MNKSISLFASAVRPKMWPAFFNSLKSTWVSYEVVFAGNATPPDGYEWPLKYIKTGNIKPSQCYEIARRHCTGELISWTCDDAEYPNDILGKAYKYWQSKKDEKFILSLQTRESYPGNKGNLYDMNSHRFFGGANSSPLMAPLALMSRKFLEDLGGYDRRYVSGQAENDILMRAYEQDASCEIFGGEDCCIEIDHIGKSLATGESKTEEDFFNRPFAKGYNTDRSVLETSWSVTNQDKLVKLLRRGVAPNPADFKQWSMTQLDKFEPYEKDISLIKSESNHGVWE